MDAWNTLDWGNWLNDSYLHFLVLLGCIGLLLFLGRCRPTGRLFLMILLPIPLLLLGFYWESTTRIFYFYNPLLCLGLLVDRFLLATQPRQLDCRRHLDSVFSIRSPNLVELTLVNNSNQTLQGIVEDAYPQGFEIDSAELPKPITLNAFGSQSIRYHAKAFARGGFQFGKIHLAYKSPLGLLWLKAESGRSDSIKVYPDLRQIKKMRLKYSRSLSAGELHKRRLGAEGTQFDSLRNYSFGDDIKKMDWNATARLDTPVLRVFTHEVEQPILILLDAGRKMQSVTQKLTKFDWALNAALAFASVAVDRGDQVGIRVFHQETVLKTAIATGKTHFKTVLDSLSALQAEPIEPDYEAVMLQAARSLKKRSLVVILTDLIDPLASKSLVKSIQAFSKNHLLVIVTFNDQELTAQVARTPENIQDAYQRGVGLDLLEIRRKTLIELAAHGSTTVIDTTPEQMDEALINHYLTLKLKNNL